MSTNLKERVCYYMKRNILTNLRRKRISLSGVLLGFITALFYGSAEYGFRNTGLNRRYAIVFNRKQQQKSFTF